MGIDPIFVGIGTGGVALIASAASLILGVKNYMLQQRKLSMEEESRQLEARRLADKFRNPLVASATELASRLYNIINLDFFIWATRGTCEKAYVETHTLYVFAQFLGWMELLSQEVQFLDLGNVERSKRLNTLLATVRSTLRASHLGDEHTFRLFQGQQRAIGEAMILEKGPKCAVMGYKTFCETYWDKRNPTLAFWLHPLAESVRHTVQAYDNPAEMCNRENRLMLFLELEMRFVRLDMLWQNLSELIRHLDPECAYHEPTLHTKAPGQWALVQRRRSELELKMREEPAWPIGSPWSNSRLLEACRTGKAADWLKKTIEAEWQRCPRTLMPAKKHAALSMPPMPLLLQIEEGEGASAAGTPKHGPYPAMDKWAGPRPLVVAGGGKEAKGGDAASGKEGGRDKGGGKDKGGDDKGGGRLAPERDAGQDGPQPQHQHEHEQGDQGAPHHPYPQLAEPLNHMPRVEPASGDVIEIVAPGANQV